jgi:hypothetical protein
MFWLLIKFHTPLYNTQHHVASKFLIYFHCPLRINWYFNKLLLLMLLQYWTVLQLNFHYIFAILDAVSNTEISKDNSKGNKIMWTKMLYILHFYGSSTQDNTKIQAHVLTWIVYLHSANVFHSFIVLSRLPDTICRLSTEKATLRTSWKIKISVHQNKF